MRAMLVLCGSKDSVRLTYSAKSSPDHLSLAFNSTHTVAHSLLRLADVRIQPLVIPQMEYGQLTLAHTRATTHSSSPPTI